jgi:TolA-binding protein
MPIPFCFSVWRLSVRQFSLGGRAGLALGVALIALLNACVAGPRPAPGTADAAVLEISTLETLAPEDSLAARALLRAYAEFGNHHHNDERTPEFLFRRALALNRGGNPYMAVAQWSDVHDGFPDYERKADCVFWVAFVSENELGDKERAKKAYLLLLEEYPDSQFAEAARHALVTLL